MAPLHQPGRVDVHHHAIVPAIAEIMRERKAPNYFTWTLGETLTVMQRSHIGMAVVSNAIPFDIFGSRHAAADAARRANDAIADLARDHPNRFSFFAAVPLPHIDLALDEARYALDELGAAGLIVLPHGGGRYLGDPMFDPFFAELDRRSTTVLVHPLHLPGTSPSDVPPVLADYLLDTTRGAISLINAESLDRFPGVTFILAHGGGFLPYAASRVETLTSEFYGAERTRIGGYVRRFCYDLALSIPSALPTLLQVAGADHILFGTDWCAVPEASVTRASRTLDAYELSVADRVAIDRGNALRILPTLAHKLAVSSHEV
ncbi:MAG TPA: amidohydrolase family protein [Rugosimonospora sp.]|nr:amidohydrolase family protein [Rugosimonospora sp.]